MADADDPVDAPETLSRAAHRQALDASAGAGGFLRDVGESHLALMRRSGPNLLVSFEDLDAVRSSPGGLPWSAGPARKRNYSTLTIMADGRTWFRDRKLFDFFDELTDDGFFDEFDTVVFAGGGIGAYAAGAFSVASPGALVFLAQPYATLDRDVTPWEHRFRSSRAMSFGPRYGNAADLIDAAAKVFVVTDPTRATDAMHASLFRGDHVIRLPAAHAGGDIWGALARIGILDRLVAMAGNDALDTNGFAELWRRRRNDADYLAGLMRKLDRTDRPWLQALLAGHILHHQGDNPAARRRLNDALARLAERGRDAPPGLSPTRPDGGTAMLLAGE
ncbi:phosphoadenosine phosphosulfate reductase [uncultured Jannaschia sp.]|uniref:phosphoadenosine phosphosulfate reductase n=1 Tax=uncultured Jannaschia sp. TaxID=293347 RepID=UPI0026043AE6|nr:phosphoadenosine phosphosulfate reductase [uncultured Jannaschia sp.]